jgi:hypothetical protein
MSEPMPEGKEIYQIELQIYRPNSTAWIRCKNIGVVNITDLITKADLTARDLALKLTGGTVREYGLEIEFFQRRATSPDRTFFMNAYNNKTTIELVICDMAIDAADMMGVRGPFRVLGAAPEGGLTDASKRKLILEPTLDDQIPFSNIAGPSYAGVPTVLS